MSSVICLLYGLFKYLGKHIAMFAILIIAAIGCFMLGHLYDTITLLIRHSIPSVFNIGMLAKIGGYSFLFSASYAQMDGLVDDKSRAMLKYRILSLAAPILIYATYLFAVFSNINTSEKIMPTVIVIFAGLSSYYNFKHLIIPDIDLGIIASIRLYNLFALLSAIFYTAMLTFNICGNFSISNIFGVLLATTYPCMVISVEKGRQKWIL